MVLKQVLKKKKSNYLIFLSFTTDELTTVSIDSSLIVVIVTAEWDFFYPTNLSVFLSLVSLLSLIEFLVIIGNYSSLFSFLSLHLAYLLLSLLSSPLLNKVELDSFFEEVDSSSGVLPQFFFIFGVSWIFYAYELSLTLSCYFSYTMTLEKSYMSYLQDWSVEAIFKASDSWIAP